MSAEGRRRRRGSVLVTVPICLVLALAAAPAAWAMPRNPFTPSLSPSMLLKASTAQAGANPNLTFTLSKRFTGCPPPWPRDAYAVFCPRDYGYPRDRQFYAEQNPKRQVVQLSPGLVADANAARYCDPDQDWVAVGDVEQFVLRCRNPDALIGIVEIANAVCAPPVGEQPPPTLPPPNPPVPLPDPLDPPPIAPPGELEPAPPPRAMMCLVSPDLQDKHPGAALVSPGFVFYGRPQQGEHARLHVLWPAQDPRDPGSGADLRTDISIRVREPDLGITATADNIPDVIETQTRPRGGGPVTKGEMPVEIFFFGFTLSGDTGRLKGHPLLTNPTFCDPQRFDVEFQGYARNSIDYPSQLNVTPPVVVPGSGDGKVASAAGFYQATRCEAVPYAPKLELGLDNPGPDRAPAIASTVTQKQGEATTGKVEVTFPSAFKINSKNTAKHCSEGELRERRCPPETRIGTVEARSPLLPQLPGLLGDDKLSGDVFLAGLSGDSLKLAALLRGRIGNAPLNMRIDATGRVGNDRSLITTFDNLPKVPVSEFKLSLLGEEKGLLRTPKTCGARAVTSKFTSHSGKVVEQRQALDIKGCGDPALKAGPSSRKPGALTDLELDVRGPASGTNTIKGMEFGLPSGMRWGIAKRASARQKRGRKGRQVKAGTAGKVSFEAAGGSLETAFSAKGSAKKVALLPRAPRLPGGKRGASQVPTFSGVLSRARKARGNAKAPGRLQLGGLPQDELIATTLALKSRSRGFFLRNPRSCRRPLSFTATVVTTDGRTLRLKDRVKLRGKGCKGRHAKGKRRSVPLARGR